MTRRTMQISLIMRTKPSTVIAMRSLYINDQILKLRVLEVLKLLEFRTKSRKFIVKFVEQFILRKEDLQWTISTFILPSEKVCIVIKYSILLTKIYEMLFPIIFTESNRVYVFGIYSCKFQELNKQARVELVSHRGMIITLSLELVTKVAM